MKRLFVFILTLLIICISGKASCSDSYWAKTFGGSEWDSASSIQQTSDGGYVAVGYSYTFHGEWILKLDSSGNIAWQKIAVNPSPALRSIQQTADEGYIAVGYVFSQETLGHDMVVLKLDVFGKVSWAKTYGGSNDGDDRADTVQQTADGGYIVAGVTQSFGDSFGDIWVLKLDSSGNIAWQKTYGEIGPEDVHSIHQVSDGGYIVGGNTDSLHRYWVIKLDNNGNVIWQKTYGIGQYNRSFSLIQTVDGGYMIGGHITPAGASSGLLLLKLDSNGNISWQNIYDSNVNESARSIQQTLDGGYIVAGQIRPFGADFYDFLVLKLGSGGNITWQKTYGSSGWEEALSIFQTTDENYMMAGNSNSFGEDDTDFDFLMLKISNNGEIPNCDIVNSVDLNIAETSLVDRDSNASVQVTSASAGETSVTTQDALLGVSIICGSEQIPTLSEWGIIIFMTLIMGISVVMLYRRREI